MLGALAKGVNTTLQRSGLDNGAVSARVRAIIRIRLHEYRGNPVISSEGESCAIQRSLKTDL
jgi:hypothetical protein